MADRKRACLAVSVDAATRTNNHVYDMEKD